MEFDERVGQGAWVSHIFRIFFLIGITALFFSRLWAVLLWLIFSAMQPMRQFILTLQNPNVYFESDWRVIISDGWAINSFILRENITFMVFFLISSLVFLCSFGVWSLGFYKGRIFPNTFQMPLKARGPGGPGRGVCWS